MTRAIVSWWEWFPQLKIIFNIFYNMFLVLFLLHFHLDPLELIDWLDSFCFFLFLFIPPSFFPSPSPHSSRTCLSGTFLSQRVAHPFLCFQKCFHCSQEMTLRFFPSKTQGAVWEQRARGWRKLGPTPRPDLDWTSCGRGGVGMSCSSLQVSGQYIRF